MMATIREGRTPSFLLLEYSPAWDVQVLTAVHHSLITQDCIEEEEHSGCWLAGPGGSAAT
jgi:hypothetical protein